MLTTTLFLDEEYYLKNYPGCVLLLQSLPDVPKGEYLLKHWNKKEKYQSWYRSLEKNESLLFPKRLLIPHTQIDM